MTAAELALEVWKANGCKGISAADCLDAADAFLLELGLHIQRTQPDRPER